MQTLKFFCDSCQREIEYEDDVLKLEISQGFRHSPIQLEFCCWKCMMKEIKSEAKRLQQEI